MIEVSIRFKRTFYQSLCPAPFQVDHANRYQLNFWKKLLKKNQTTFLILTAIESRFAFACVRAVCVIATCIIVTAMDVAGTLVHI